MPAQLIWPATLTLLLLWGAASDIKWRLLPNWLAVLLLIFGLVFAFVDGGLEGVGWHFAHSVVVLLAGMGLFAAGIFGGGDAKFYAGMAAFFPLTMGLDLLLFVALVGGALALSWIIARRFAPSLMGSRKDNFAKLPYGVAIAAGGIALAWMPQIAT